MKRTPIHSRPLLRPLAVASPPQAPISGCHLPWTTAPAPAGHRPLWWRNSPSAARHSDAARCARLWGGPPPSAGACHWHPATRVLAPHFSIQATGPPPRQRLGDHLIRTIQIPDPQHPIRRHTCNVPASRVPDESDRRTVSGPEAVFHLFCPRPPAIGAHGSAGEHELIPLCIPCHCHQFSIELEHGFLIPSGTHDLHHVSVVIRGQKSGPALAAP